MSTVTLSLRLRPIRFAFLVRPDDAKRTLEIFCINTCLWGGKYNPIIPFFKRRPSWWERKGSGHENAKQIINGYLDFFEPDFLVEAEEGLAEGFGFDPERVLKLTDLLDYDGKHDRGKYGFDVHDLYDDLYKKIFQFERRHNYRVVHVKAKSTAFQNFVACVFGDFPSKAGLQSFERHYQEAFDPEGITLNADALSHFSESRSISALRLGHVKLKVEYHWQEDPTLFILDAHEPKDLIDFWNLRAIQHNIIPVPVQWLEQLSPFCKQFKLANYRPLPGNPNGVMIRPITMFSRSISEDDIEELHKRYLRVAKVDANVLQTWYPPIWRKLSEHGVRPMRPTLEADSRKTDIPIDEENSEVRFATLFPEFYSEFNRGYSWANGYRWANVVRLKSWSSTDLIATVFPCNYKKPLVPKFGSIRDWILPTTEGFVIFPQHKDIDENWKLTDGTTALNSWFKENGIKAIPSDAGRATQQIIQTLGGFWALSSLAHKGIVELLNAMSRKSGTRSAHVKEFRQKIYQAVEGQFFRERRQEASFQNLVERKAVELGLELKCPKCGSWSWYSVNMLAYTLTCDLCLKEFDFPVASPTDGNRAKWAYRLIGPFALPDYARGGYAAVLSIRFFALSLDGMMDSSITWSSGQELTLAQGEKSEADFVLWSQRQAVLGNDHPTEVVFGEAKSFGKDAFKADDVTKMKRLAESFPGCIIVFATLKEVEDLSPGEIGCIKKLAHWGREYDKERRQPRAQVIMLTGTELFATDRLRMTWRNKGGKHKDLIESGWARTDNLRTLADLTQQLYLAMPSYGTWLEEKWKKRSKRLKKKPS